ncbi:hypothetical protein EDB19DRAFT_1908418 [Suillus lakei]|nr:hypothetical protein EDB19DRAFT_1908418 [Suillus lakei]
MPASLITTPAELLEQIVVIATRQHHQGPPSVLRSLRLTDRFSPWRHFPGGQLTVDNIEHELRKRFRALQRIRRGDIADPDILESLSTIYIMILEDDGRNWDQLLWAQLPIFMTRFLRERLMVGAETNNGWPTENEVSSHPQSSFTSIRHHYASAESIRDETDELRREFVELLSPYSFAGFRYPCFTGLEYDFCPSENSPKTIVTSAHGAYPPIRPVSTTSMLFWATGNTRPLMIPPHLPETRVEALANGIPGPAKEDIVYFNTRCRTHLPGTMYGNRFDTLLKSRRHDPDWTRSIRDPLYRSPSSLPGQYIPGTISGRWQGSFIVEFLYHAGIEFNGENASFKAYYSPPRKEHLEIGFVGSTTGESKQSAHGAFDVIITGVTEDRYAAAWGGYRYMGRIRPSDGLIVLLREPLDPQMVELGRALFRGYIISSRNFVGRWRCVSSGVRPAEWESIFSLCKDVSWE